MEDKDTLRNKVKSYNSHKKSRTSGRIHVSNLPWKLKRHELINLFNSVTKVHSVYMNYTIDNKFTGYAFVSVEDKDKAKSLNGIVVMGREVFIKDAVKNEKYVEKIKKVAHEQEKTSPGIGTPKKDNAISGELVQGKDHMLQGKERKHKRRS